MFKNLMLSIFALFLMAGPAFAQVALTGVDLDTDTVLTLAATVVTGLGVIWGVRKVIKLVNRS